MRRNKIKRGLISLVFGFEFFVWLLRNAMKKTYDNFFFSRLISF
jgi:hypothetical protein